MDEHRSRRVSVAVREELSEIIGFELSDPRLGSVDVTDVTVSPDSRHAMVKVNLSGGEQEQNQAMAALDHARNYLRHEQGGHGLAALDHARNYLRHKQGGHGLAALDHARNYLRHELASRLNLRKIPELHFAPDHYPDAATRVEILLKRAKKKRAPTENQP